MHAARHVLTALGALALLSSLPVARGVEPLRLTLNSIEARVEPWQRGLSIFFDGIPISSGSGMVITTPPWAPHYYVGPSAGAIAAAERNEQDGRAQVTLVHRSDQEGFAGRETLTISGNRVEQFFEGRFRLAGQEALIQWQIAALNPTLIIGCSYRAELRTGELREGVVPVRAEHAEVGPATLATDFNWIEFDSRIGPLRIEVETNRPLTCYDHRRNKWADANRPLFWLGDLGSRFGPDQPIQYRVSFILPPTVCYAAQPKTQAAGLPTSPDPLRVQVHPQCVSPRVVPRPKAMSIPKDRPYYYARRTGSIRPPLTIQLNVARPEDEALISPGLAEYQRHFRLLDGEFKLRRGSDPLPEGGLRFELPPPGTVIPPQGYHLTPTPEALRVQAGDAAGFRHAVQTLKQLTFTNERGEVAIANATVRDWPTLAFRGVHLFTGGQGPALHEQLIRNVIAGLKMNRLVLQCDYLKWDINPRLHHAEWGMSKDDVRRILAACDEVGVEVIPLVTSLGHMQWMFHNDQNLDLAEDLEARWAYCVTNPKSYEFIFGVYAEALELFRPRTIHIGHDEFIGRGRVPFRESSQAYTSEDLFLQDTLRIHKWLAERGVRTMLWGDMLLAKGEAPDATNARASDSARRLREALPDDIIIADWHDSGDPPEAFQSLATLQEEGHQTVAATWSRPANIVNFARTAAQHQSLGLLQTTWAGYSLDPGSFAKNLPQYTAYVLAAEAAWNADAAPDPEHYIFGDEFYERMGLGALRPALRTGWTADLAAACNYSLRANDERGWFGLGPALDLSQAPVGETWLRGILFQIPAHQAGAGGIALAGKLTRSLDLPNQVELTVDRPAATLALLITANFPGKPDEAVATLRATFEGGGTAELELVYGQNVFAFTDVTAAPAAPIAWQERDPPRALRLLLWDLPTPVRTLQKLALVSRGGVSSPVIVAITGLDPASTNRP